MSIIRSFPCASARRLFSSTRGSVAAFEEVKIPVPWGHISGKWWGDMSQAPMIAIHDIKQNASVFDKLIPKLNLKSVLAIDLPGHGQSSHLHKGRYLSHLEYLIALRYLTRKLPIGLISFMGHGFGSLLAFLFSASYFKLVDTVISIECSRHILSELNFTKPNAIGVFADRYEEIEKCEVTRPYTTDELRALIKSTSRDMSDEAASTLIARSTKQENGKLYFTHDLRTEIMPMSYFTEKDMLMMDGHVRTTTAVIRNVMDDELMALSQEEEARPACFDSNTSKLIRRIGSAVARERYVQGVQRLSDSCRLLVTHEIRAPRHIVLDHSDKLALIVNDFLATDLEAHEYYYKTS